MLCTTSKHGVDGVRDIAQCSAPTPDLNGWSCPQVMGIDGVQTAESLNDGNSSTGELNSPEEDDTRHGFHSSPLQHPQNTIAMTSAAEEFQHHVRHFTDDIVNSEVPISTFSQIAAPAINDLPKDDASFLAQRNCFKLPSAKILEKLLTEFFRRVHPQLPILDEVDFFSILYGPLSARSKTPKVSLLVLHAMLHVACSVRTGIELLKWHPLMRM
jgi:hypothetical protein